jgi:hypothetical protein
MDTIGKRLTDARKKRGFATAKDAALAMGVAISTYTQHELAERFLPARKAALYAAFFRTEPEWLLYGRTANGDGGPACVQLVDEGGVEVREIPGPPCLTPLTKAYEISQKDGMGEAFVGWCAFFEMPEEENAPILEGPLSVVAVRGPQGLTLYARRVRASAIPGRFHLLPLLGDPELDVEVVWNALITGLCPA